MHSCSIIISGSDSQNDETISPGVSSENYVVDSKGIIIHPHLPSNASAHHTQKYERNRTHTRGRLRLMLEESCFSCLKCNNEIKSNDHYERNQHDLHHTDNIRQCIGGSSRCEGIVYIFIQLPNNSLVFPLGFHWNVILFVLFRVYNLPTRWFLVLLNRGRNIIN